jgi:phosphoribosylanthranilate isomerase
MTRVKICGITTSEDALAICAAGADAIGFVFAKSPRQVSRDAVAEIVRKLPLFVTTVGVFVDETIDSVRETMQSCRLKLAQLHGNEDDRYCKALRLPFIKAFSLREEQTLRAIEVLPYADFLVDSHSVDASGGTGRVCDWSLAARASKLGRMVLAGGLTPANVRSALEAVHPYAVDASSGVELSPGKKDISKVQQFINEVHTWDFQTNGDISASTVADLFPRH